MARSEERRKRNKKSRKQHTKSSVFIVFPFNRNHQNQFSFNQTIQRAKSEPIDSHSFELPFPLRVSSFNLNPPKHLQHLYFCYQTSTRRHHFLHNFPLHQNPFLHRSDPICRPKLSEFLSSQREDLL